MKGYYDAEMHDEVKRIIDLNAGAITLDVKNMESVRSQIITAMALFGCNLNIFSISVIRRSDNNIFIAPNNFYSALFMAGYVVPERVNEPWVDSVNLDDKTVAYKYAGITFGQWGEGYGRI